MNINTEFTKAENCRVLAEDAYSASLETTDPEFRTVLQHIARCYEKLAVLAEHCQLRHHRMETKGANAES